MRNMKYSQETYNNFELICQLFVVILHNILKLFHITETLFLSQINILVTLSSMPVLKSVNVQLTIYKSRHDNLTT